MLITFLEGGETMMWDTYEVYENVNWIFVAQNVEDWQACVNVEVEFWVQ
jgi:hypothetical protein